MIWFVVEFALPLAFIYWALPRLWAKAQDNNVQGNISGLVGLLMFVNIFIQYPDKPVLKEDAGFKAATEALEKVGDSFTGTFFITPVPGSLQKASDISEVGEKWAQNRWDEVKEAERKKKKASLSSAAPVQVVNSVVTPVVTPDIDPWWWVLLCGVIWLPLGVGLFARSRTDEAMTAVRQLAQSEGGMNMGSLAKMATVFFLGRVSD